jgi:D-3-phosphoglycerate dehydrogenase
MRGPLSSKSLLEVIHKYDGIICSDDEYTSDVIKKGASAKLKVISKYGVGLDSIDLEECKEHGIAVTNCPGVNQNSVAEHVLALLFAFYKNLPIHFNNIANHDWIRLTGEELFGKKLGIIGLGNIGKELAKKSKAIGLEVGVFDINLDKEYIKTEGLKSLSLQELVEGSEIVSLNLPLNQYTRGIINDNTFKLMNPKTVIVNTSRAELIDQKILFQALNAKEIRAYLTDVMVEEPLNPKDPIITLTNCYITPHIASRTKQNVERQGIMAVQNLIRVLSEK